MFGDALSFTTGAAVYALFGFIVGVVAGRLLPKPLFGSATGATGTTGARSGQSARAPERRERRPEAARRNGGGDRDRGGERERGGDRGRDADRDRGGRDNASSGGTGLGVELYVGNLPYDTTDKELGRAFEPFGRVLSVRMIENRRNGKPKGFGFVEMDSEGTAQQAIKAMNGTDFKGRSLVVNEAKSRERDL